MELKLRSVGACDFNKHLRTRSAVEADVIVPDTKPDIFRILSVKAHADMNERYMRKDKIIYSGNVRFNIIYVGEVDKKRLHTIEYVAPFNCQADSTGIDEQCMGMTSCSVSKTDFHIKNSRKLGVGANLCFCSTVIKPCEISAVEGAEGDDCVPVRYAQYDYDSVRVCKEIEIPLSESFSLPISRDTNAEVCDVDVRMEIPEIKTVNNKAVIKGNGRAITLCEIDGEISSFENELSFTEICDLDGVSSDMTVKMHFDVADCNFSVEASGEEVGIEMQYKLRGFVCAGEHMSMSLADDMYDPDYSYIKKETEVVLMQNYGPFGVQATVKDVATPRDSGAEIKEVHFMNALCEIKSSYISETNICADVIVYTDYIYTDSSQCLANIRKEIPYKLEIPCGNGISGNADVDISITNFGYTLNSATEIQARIILKANATVADEKKVTLITDFSSDKNSPTDKSVQPSIVVCYPSDSLDIWNIAKKHNTTSEAIALINGFESDSSVTGGKPVMIPKRKVSKLQ